MRRPWKRPEADNPPETCSLCRMEPCYCDTTYEAEEPSEEYMGGLFLSELWQSFINNEEPF